jgi:hypothetical protein
MADDNRRAPLPSDVEAMLKQIATRADFEKIIADEAAKTRRHFEIALERMTELMKALADEVAQHSAALEKSRARRLAK